MSEYSHVAPKFREVMGLTDLERLEFLEIPRWIDYPAGDKLLNYLQGILHKPIRTRMPNVLVVGESYTGKSTLISRFAETCGAPFVDENSESVKPVIIVEVSEADTRQLFVAILQQFWAPHNPTAPIAKLRSEVDHMLRECRTRMLVVDEIQALRKGSPKNIRQVMDELKRIGNVLKISIVGVGVREAAQLLNADAQYASRFEVVTLPSWEVNKTFQAFLKSYESILPLKKASHLYSPEMTRLIFMMTGGITGYVETLLLKCAKEAIQSGVECIDRRLLEKHQWTLDPSGTRKVTL